MTSFIWTIESWNESGVASKSFVLYRIGITQPLPRDGAWSALFINLSKSAWDSYVVKRSERPLLEEVAWSRLLCPIDSTSGKVAWFCSFIFVTWSNHATFLMRLSHFLPKYCFKDYNTSKQTVPNSVFPPVSTSKPTYSVPFRAFAVSVHWSKFLCWPIFPTETIPSPKRPISYLKFKRLGYQFTDFANRCGEVLQIARMNRWR